MKHIVTVHLLVEVESEFGIVEVEDDFFNDLMSQLDGLYGEFTSMIENPDYDDMAVETEPNETDKAEGYFQVSGNETEEEIEELFEWSINDATIDSVKDVDWSMFLSYNCSIRKYLKEIAKREESKPV